MQAQRLVQSCDFEESSLEKNHLHATAESGTEFVFSRPSATGAYFAYVTAAGAPQIKGKGAPLYAVA